LAKRQQKVDTQRVQKTTKLWCRENWCSTILAFDTKGAVLRLFLNTNLNYEIMP
jgi:hypothetical protein